MLLPEPPDISGEIRGSLPHGVKAVAEIRKIRPHADMVEIDLAKEQRRFAKEVAREGGCGILRHDECTALQMPHHLTHRQGQSWMARSERFKRGLLLGAIDLFRVQGRDDGAGAMGKREGQHLQWAARLKRPPLQQAAL